MGTNAECIPSGGVPSQRHERLHAVGFFTRRLGANGEDD